MGDIFVLSLFLVIEKDVFYFVLFMIFMLCLVMDNEVCVVDLLL